MAHKDKSPAFQFYVDKFLSGVKHFSTEETGAYILLLCEQWDSGFIKKDEKFLKKITGISAKKCHKILEKFTETENGIYKNLRLEVERNKQAEWRAKSSKGGKNSAKNKSDQSSTIIQPPLKIGEHQKPTLHSTSTSTKDIIINKGLWLQGVHHELSPSEYLLIKENGYIETVMISVYRGMNQDELLKRFDIEYPLYQFNSVNHIKNSLKKVAEKIKNGTATKGVIKDYENPREKLN